MKVTIELNEEVIEHLEKWRRERLSDTKESIEREENELVKRALMSSYEIVKNAEYGFLAQNYLSYQVVEEKYKEREW